MFYLILVWLTNCVWFHYDHSSDKHCCGKDIHYCSVSIDTQKEKVKPLNNATATVFPINYQDCGMVKGRKHFDVRFLFSLFAS